MNDSLDINFKYIWKNEFMYKIYNKHFNEILNHIIQSNSKINNSIILTNM